MGKNRFTPKFNIKKGDTVMVVAGNDKGKTGKVLEVLYKKSKVFVEDVAMVSKHQKPDAKNPDGGIVKKEAAIHISNVMLVDPTSGKPTRISIKREEGKVVRLSKKSGEVI
ncbi:MAG: large subunit ribosomal protein L24 [Planctomycetota bacterium]|jgi:large subunit ribosomal protein L24